MELKQQPEGSKMSLRSGYSKRGGKMYLIGEEHPSHYRGIAGVLLDEAFRLVLFYLGESGEKLTNKEIGLVKLLLELFDTYKAGYNPDYFDCINSLLQDKRKKIEKLIEKLKNDTNRKKLELEIIKTYVRYFIEIYKKSYGIVKREHEILEKIISSSDSENIIIYCEGDKEVVEKERPDIIELIKRYNEKKIEIVPLDEGNENYKKWSGDWILYYYDSELRKFIRDPYNYSSNKNQYLEKMKKIQEGREDFWIEKIKSRRIDNTLQIAIVGVDHLDPSNEKIYSFGSFAKKLEELGYDIEINHVTSY
jgi:hypothetical protein